MMFDDMIPQLPAGDELAQPGNGESHDLTIKTMNSNMGAIRVQVRRDMRAVRLQVAQLAAYFGDSFEYKLPFKKRDRQTGRTTVEIVAGPSVRCTTAVARAYGNCSVDVTAEENPAGYLFEAAFLDVETGFRLTRPFRQRRDQNIGSMGGDAGRVQDVVFQIGASKATRNVIRNALPDLCEFAVEQARDNLVARITKSRGEVETRIVSRLAEHDIPLSRVESFYGGKLATLNPRVLAQLVGLLRAVSDGMMTAAEVCPTGQQAPAAGEPMPERAEGDEHEEGLEEEPAQARAPQPAEELDEQEPHPAPEAGPEEETVTAPEMTTGGFAWVDRAGTCSRRYVSADEAVQDLIAHASRLSVTEIDMLSGLNEPLFKAAPPEAAQAYVRMRMQRAEPPRRGRPPKA